MKQQGDLFEEQGWHLLMLIALLSAAFSHLYLWVQYLCTELPDMRRIYTKA